jgi:hypothetical protein
MPRRSETCENCDYETPAEEMTTWRSPIVTRVFLPPEDRLADPGPDAWRSGPFLYRKEVLEQQVCVWCAARLGAGAPFGQVGRNRLKFGLVVCLAIALAGAVGFPALQPMLTIAFWQAPEENGGRSAAYVFGPRSSGEETGRSSSTLGFPR